MSKTTKKKIAVPATPATPDNTPNRARSTQAKTPARRGTTDGKTARRLQTPRNSQGRSSSENDDDSSNESRIDFLGIPPSNQNSDDEIEEEEVSDEEEMEERNEEDEEDDDDDDNDGEDDGDDSRAARNVENDTAQRTSGRRSRKQSKPKKRKDNVTRDILKFQSTTKLLVPRLPFQRVVREVVQQFQNDFRLQSEALECLQESSEAYLVQLFEDANLACFHRSRVTLDVKDMRLVRVIRGSNDPGRK